jgi:hydroxylamine dehydrogenase
MRTFQGTFHASPDYALCYGWSEMQRDLTEIRELAAQMRQNKKGAAVSQLHGRAWEATHSK